MANSLPPAPIDNDPKPSTEAAQKKQAAWLSANAWGSFKTWFNLLYQLLKGLTSDQNGNITVTGNLTVDGTTTLEGTTIVQAATTFQSSVTVDGPLTALEGVNGLPSPDQAIDGVFGFIAGGAVGLTVYNPNAQVSTGSFTIGSQNGYYYQVGKIVFFLAQVGISAVTTPGFPFVSLPLPIAAYQGSGPTITPIVAGRETAITGNMLQGVPTSATTMAIVNYSNGNTAIAAGYNLVISGCYLTP